MSSFGPVVSGCKKGGEERGREREEKDGKKSQRKACKMRHFEVTACMGKGKKIQKKEERRKRKKITRNNGVGEEGKERRN